MHHAWCFLRVYLPLSVLSSLFLGCLCLFPLCGFMINIISWNCRGAGARYFPRLVRDLKLNYNVNILIIVKPRVSGQRADKIISKLGFCNYYRIEATGFSGRIWLLSEGERVSINIISSSHQFLHTSISYNASK